MEDRVATQDYKKAIDRNFRHRIRKKYPVPGLVKEAEYYWTMLLPEVVSNRLFRPSWIMALKLLCNCLIEERIYMEAILVSGAMSKDAMKLELVRSRIAEFSNFCGLSSFLIAPALPPLREMVKRKEQRLYEKSILREVGAEGEEAAIKKKSEWG